jgi:gliding motility-associated-like protein
MVQDAAGCYDSINVTINEPPAIVINVLNMEDNACNGGAAGVIDVQATGGSNGAVFSYTWSNLGGPQFATGPSVGSLAAGTYVVTASYLNPQGQTCSNPDTLEIFEPLPMDLSLVVGNIGCSGQATGSLEAVVANIVDPLSYAWSNNATLNQAINGDLAPGNYSVTVTDGNGCTESESGTVELVGNPMTLSSTVDHVNCFNGNDGSATINISGGTPGYVVNWPLGVIGNGNSAQNLEAGLYVVQVIDANNCDMTLNVTVNEPSVLAVNIQNIVDVLCYGQANGQATAGITGGTTSYQVLWNNGETNVNAVALPQGNIAVTVTDANGCTATDSDTMDEPQPLTAVVGITEPSCFGGNDGVGEVTINGGTPNYTADWSNSSTNGEIVNNLTAGNQSVTVTDANGCQVVQNFNLFEPAAMTANFNITGDVCGDLVANGSASVTISGGTPNYSYTWDQGSSVTSTQSNLNDGPIQVVVSDNNGCIQNFTANIPVIETPVASFVSTPEFDPLSTVISGYLPLEVSFDDQSLYGSSSSWNWGNDTQTFSTGTDITHEFDSLGYHNVTLTVTGPGGCTSDLDFIVFVYDSAQIASFNFFTPNNDGYNDVYRVSCENFYGGVYYDCGEFTVREFSGKILNRWGSVVYEWTDVNKGWDGKINGQPATEGQYLFLGNAKLYDGKEFEFQEWLNLSR